MKTKLDQISIPPLCGGLLELAHTLVGKALPLQLKGHGFNPQCGQSAGPEARLETQEQQNFMLFPFFLCFDVVPFVGDP